jgi:hypothetical protein
MGGHPERSEAGAGKLILTTTEQRFSTADLAKLAGLSMRVLQGWHRRDVAPASEDRHGEKIYLSYTVDQAATVLALVDLHDRGMSWKIIKRIAAFLPRPITKHQFLIADKKIIYGRDDHASTIKAACSMANPALVIEVEDITSRVSSRESKR